jgi:hypothetical protein
MEDHMTTTSLGSKTFRGVALATALVAGVALTAAPARAGVSPLAAVGIGVGALAVGTALGAAAANPYYNGYPNNYYGYPSGYYAPPATYYPAPTYYAPSPYYAAPYYR